MSNVKVTAGWKKKRATPDAPKFQAKEPLAGWSKYSHVTCYKNGTHYFGVMPELYLREKTIPSYQIVMLYGEHFKANSGFGFMHSWIEHFNHISDHDMAMKVISDSASSVLQSGSEIYHDYNRTTNSPRFNAFRISTGSVIMELMCPPKRQPYYSIITCGFGSSSTKKGTLVGTF